MTGWPPGGFKAYWLDGLEKVVRVEATWNAALRLGFREAVKGVADAFKALALAMASSKATAKAVIINVAGRASLREAVEGGVANASYTLHILLSPLGEHQASDIARELEAIARAGLSGGLEPGRVSSEEAAWGVVYRWMERLVACSGEGSPAAAAEEASRIVRTVESSPHQGCLVTRRPLAAARRSLRALLAVRRVYGRGMEETVTYMLDCADDRCNVSLAHTIHP